MISSPMIQGKNQVKAMTLVEIVLALGIIAIAIVPVIGLLAVGLNTLRNATEETARARIVNFVNADLRSRIYDTNAYIQGATYSKLSSSNILISSDPSINVAYYFDVQGNYITNVNVSQDPPDKSRIIYRAIPTGRLMTQTNLTNSTIITNQTIGYNIQIAWPYITNSVLPPRSNTVPATLFPYEL